MEIDRVTLQSLESSLGTELAIRSCAPIALFMLLKANGYLSESMEPDEFMRSIDRNQLSVDAGNPMVDWSRPALSRFLRKKYDATIISWQFGWPPPTDFPAMIKAGYIESDKEIDFFKKHVEGKPIEEIVKAGFPVIATMKPGFGTPDNKIIHAIIVVRWDDKVLVVDPDARNPKTQFDATRVKEFISPKGAGTVILPKDE